LPTPAAWWSTASERAPLAAAYEIVTLPSAQTLAVLRQQATGRTKAPKAVAVLADPVFDAEDARVRARGKSDIQKQEGGATPSRSADQLLRSLGDVGLSVEGRLHLARLAFSRQEATAIVAAVPAGQSLAAFDFKANRQTATSVDLAQYRTIHYATHGLLNSVHPQLSGLVLSMVDEQGRPQDGYLDLGDIYNLNLPAELVVLSACETGLGKEISGEGVIGLTRGFMYAGASRVVASLWKVDDVATAELMGRFYRAMEKDGMRPAAALRRAQMEMWQQERWRTPYYWAAFQLQGEWK